jgi:hypothetical protein
MTTPSFRLFESHLKKIAEVLRGQMASFEGIHHFELNIEIGGRPDGDIKIEHRLAVNYTNSTRGGTLEETMNEVLRRYGWSVQNAPLCLPKVEKETEI